MADSPTLLHSCKLPTGKSCLAVVAKRTYRFRRGKVELSGEQDSIVAEPEYVKSRNADAGPRLVHDSDLLGVAKPLTDVLVSATACSLRGPVRRLDTAVEVGPAARAVRVFGDRRVRLESGGRLAFTESDPFERMPITWDNAFGGRDVFAEEKLFPRASGFGRGRVKPDGGALSYPRNRAGRGFFIDVDRERLEGRLAPNLEDPDDPVTPDRLVSTDPDAWIDSPVAACYGPIDHATFPRAAFLIYPKHGAPRRPLRELAVGALFPADLAPRPPLPPNPRLYNAAPPGLAVRRLTGGERVRLKNLHVEAELVEFNLPTERPAMFLELPNIGARKLEPTLQTVHIDADRSTVSMTWAGSIDVASPFPEALMKEMRYAAVYREP